MFLLGHFCLEDGFNLNSLLCKRISTRYQLFNENQGRCRGVIDDLPYARTAANFLKDPLNIVEIDSSKMANDLEEMIFQLDEPLADPAPLNVLYIQTC